MHKKCSNLAVAVDVTNKEALLHLADQIGPEICVLKTHIDIIEDFDQDLIVQLKRLAKKHNFLIMEDRKFADIGITVQKQYKSGIYHIVDWADIIIVHAIAGEQSILALKQTVQGYERSALLIAQLSCEGNLIDESYTNKALEIAHNHNDFIIGLIAQEACSCNTQLLKFMPGVSIAHTNDALGQHYHTPEYAIEKCHADIIIVGRGICQAYNPRAAAIEYRKIAWELYKKSPHFLSCRLSV